jgi:hypothetical protein
MPAERVPMRDAREIIRLKFSAQVATREIARRLGMAPSTVRETLKRLAGAGLSWPLPEGLSDAELEAKLYAFRRSKRGHRLHVEPDWQAVHRELKRKHVTLQIVWDEYCSRGATGSSGLGQWSQLPSHSRRARSARAWRLYWAHPTVSGAGRASPQMAGPAQSSLQRCACFSCRALRSDDCISARRLTPLHATSSTTYDAAQRREPASIYDRW